MSTRANIKITDGYADLWFYRHSDGYPEGTLPTLNKFMEWLKDDRIRGNVGQAAGWLILLGIQEYATGNYGYPDGNEPLKDAQPGHDTNCFGWKIGAYEPTTGQHGDIEYLYTIDLANKTLTAEKV